MNKNNEDRLRKIVSKVFLLEESEINDGLSRKSIEQWDSMGHLMLMSEIESQFSIFVPDEDMTKIKTVGDIKEVLRRLGVAV